MSTDPFDPETPVEYVSPSAEAIPGMVDQIGTMLSVQSILLYRIYDLLSVIANSADKRMTKIVMERHEAGDLISPPAWYNEEQIDNPQE